MNDEIRNSENPCDSRFYLPIPECCHPEPRLVVAKDLGSCFPGRSGQQQLQRCFAVLSMTGFEFFTRSQPWTNNPARMVLRCLSEL